jgi:organic hydroperoxide reductase OsmC/OhrA
MDYEATIRWTRKASERFLDGRYSRAHEWLFDGGARVTASASPHVVRVPFADLSGVDPEEAFVASIASCHMLFFLSLAARRGFIIDNYDDSVVGVLGKTDDCREWMTKVTLRPRVELSGDKRPTAEDVDTLHHEVHAACYIANSIKTDIVVQGQAIGCADPNRAER